jgi:hypothetical protein
MRTYPWRPLLFGCAAVLLGGSAVSAAPAPKKLPPLYDSFLPPAVGASYTDPVFGVAIRRLSDAPTLPNNFAGGELLFVSTEYPTASPFNSTNSRLILQHQGYFGLYDGDGNYVQDLPFAANAGSEPRWSRSDPDILYYVAGNSLMHLDVATGTSTVVRAFPEYAAIRGRGESDISRDGNHFVFAADELSGPTTEGLANRYVFVYTISTDTKGPVLDTIGHPFNSLYIAPNNNVVVGWIPTGTGRFTGVELFDKNMNFKRQLTHALGHMHLTRDTNGNDVLVWTNSNDPAPIDCQNGLVKVRLSDAQQTCLLELDWSLAVHITAPDGNGWVFAETYAPGDPPANLASWPPYANEILQVKLDGTETRRLLHHRSRPVNDYLYQPRATISRDGKRLVFTSNYNLASILGRSNDYADVYSVAVPAQVPPQVSIADGSVLEGASGTTALSFAVTLSQASDLPVSVTYATADVTATAPGDYAAIPPTTLLFAPGETAKTITVLVNGDLALEPTETLVVNLTNPSSLIIDDGQGQGTIVSDDSLDGDGLTGTYFPNATLSGPGQSRVDPTVNFNWGTAAPGFGGLGADNFTIRWTGQVETLFTQTYTFCTRTDDGARLWVNNQMLVDKFVAQSTKEWCGSLALQAGHKYDIKMEYLEKTGGTIAQLRWSSPSVPKAIIPKARLYSTSVPPTPTLSISNASVVEGQSGTANLTFAVSLSPASQQTVTVTRATADGSATAPTDYTALAPATLTFNPGETSKSVTVPVNGDLTLEANETLVVNLTSPVNAQIGDGQGQGTIVSDDSLDGDGLTGTYFPNATLSGSGQSRVDPTVDFNWGTAAPGFGGLGADNFTIRWTGQVETLFTQTYTFCTRTDDGARLWVNNQMLVDKWVAQSPTQWCGSLALQAGHKYDIRMEYLEKTGGTVAQLFWSSPSVPKAIIPTARLYSTAP